MSVAPLDRRAEQRTQRQRPAVVQVGVVLPGVADAAQRLDAVVYRVDRRVDRDHRGHGGGELALAARRGPRGIPHRCGGLFGAGQHPGAAVLDRLELPDRAAELVPDLGVLGGGLHRPVGDAAGLGAEQDRGQLGNRRPGPGWAAPGRPAR